jgi:hypothetical protein
MLRICMQLMTALLDMVAHGSHGAPAYVQQLFNFLQVKPDSCCYSATYVILS